MFDRNWALSLIANTTKEQCAEMSSLFGVLADMPRGPGFTAMVRRKLADAPAFDLAAYMGALRGEQDRRDRELKAMGLLPHQMRERLEHLGYRPDSETIEVPSVETFLAWKEEERLTVSVDDALARSERSVWEIVGRSSRAECRELAALFGSLAAVERGPAFTQLLEKQSAAQPREQSEIERRIEAGDRRVVEGCDLPLWRTGWHPIQMRHELEKRGHSALSAYAEP